MTAWEVCSDLSRLHPQYRDKEERLQAAIHAEGLPLRVWETKRSSLRQRGLYARGRVFDQALNDWRVVDQTKVVTNTPNWSPHIFGLAVDRILIPDSSFWLGDAPLHPWDTGLERDKSGKQVIVRPQVTDVWRRLGRLASSSGIEWGGRFERKGQDWHILGWDPYHTQHFSWRKMAISLRSDPSALEK